MSSIHDILEKLTIYRDNNIQKYETIFKQNTQLGLNYYTDLKTTIESQVVIWKWATDIMFSSEPFYFEEHQYKLGKWLEKEPENTENYYCYGFNANNQIIIERHGFFTFGRKNFAPQYYETFFIYNEKNLIIESIYFTYDKKDYPANQHFFEYENNHLIYDWAFFLKNNGNSLDYYIFQEELPIFKYKIHSKEPRVSLNYISYHYNQHKQLDYIQCVYDEKPTLLYKTPAQPIDKQTVKQWLVAYIQTQIQKNNPENKIYAFFLFYGSEHLIPPSLYYGYQSYRDAILNTNDVEYSYIWNPAEFPENHELLYPNDYIEPELIFIYNQEAEYNEIELLLSEVAIEIKEWLKQHYSSLLTEDFSVVLTHYELHTLDQFFKIINPELYPQFKPQFKEFT